MSNKRTYFMDCIVSHQKMCDRRLLSQPKLSQLHLHISGEIQACRNTTMIATFSLHCVIIIHAISTSICHCPFSANILHILSLTLQWHYCTLSQKTCSEYCSQDFTVVIAFIITTKSYFGNEDFSEWCVLTVMWGREKSHTYTLHQSTISMTLVAS